MGGGGGGDVSVHVEVKLSTILQQGLLYSSTVCIAINKGPKCQLGILSVHKSERAIHISATKAHWKIVVKLAGMWKALTSRSQPNASYKKTLQINQLLADAIPPLMS